MKRYLCTCDKQHDGKKGLIACYWSHDSDPTGLINMIGECGDKRFDEYMKELWLLRLRKKDEQDIRRDECRQTVTRVVTMLGELANAANLLEAVRYAEAFQLVANKLKLGLKETA